MPVRPAALAVLALCPLALPATAQSIAFAQAPEQSSGVGVGATIEEAIADAKAECVGGGALAEDCFVTAACDYAGWTADFFVQHTEGNHWHETFCGLPEETSPALMEAVICDIETRPYLLECALVQVWSPNGTALMEWRTRSQRIGLPIRINSAPKTRRGTASRGLAGMARSSAT